MPKPTDIRITAATMYFLPLQLRVPLKFGTETVTEVECLRVSVTVTDDRGHTAVGWGETPLSVQWAWPSSETVEHRLEAMKQFCWMLAEEWTGFDATGHAFEIGHDFQKFILPALLQKRNVHEHDGSEPMPWLAALICLSAFDIALHDAYGNMHLLPVYETYGPHHMNRDLSEYLTPAEDAKVMFDGLYPQDFLYAHRQERLPAWHLVGGLDAVDEPGADGQGPADGEPAHLAEWIRRDGLKCIKIKLRGTDLKWDYHRILQVGRVALENGVDWLSLDYNCTVTDPEYVNKMLDRLRDDHARLYGMVLYVEQPFPHDLKHHPIDVRSVSARKPLFLDESAHNWQLVKLGRELGWTGVALKTCKTQTGALLAACWAKAHGMTLMVQDLTNPMLAQIPHVQLAAYTGTIMGVETNAMQFYPEASRPEEAVHPGIYRRRGGSVDLSTIHGSGFGYRLREIQRNLPVPAALFAR